MLLLVEHVQSEAMKDGQVKDKSLIVGHIIHYRPSHSFFTCFLQLLVVCVQIRNCVLPLFLLEPSMEQYDNLHWNIPEIMMLRTEEGIKTLIKNKTNG